MCWYCGSPVKDEVIGRSLRCAECGRDMRVCKHCRFFLPGSRGDCSETNAEPAADKERANFCDWFSLDPRFRQARAKRQNEDAGGARSAFENLFK